MASKFLTIIALLAVAGQSGCASDEQRMAYAEWMKKVGQSMQSGGGAERYDSQCYSDCVFKADYSQAYCKRACSY